MIYRLKYLYHQFKDTNDSVDGDDRKAKVTAEGTIDDLLAENEGATDDVDGATPVLERSLVSKRREEDAKDAYDQDKSDSALVCYGNECIVQVREA